MRSRSNIACVVTMMLIVTGLVSIMGSNGYSEGEAGPRAPLIINAFIEIDGNFSEKATQEGWDGTGLESDPYVIEQLDIDASGLDYGIYIVNTEDHFIIRNCSISNADGTMAPRYPGTNLYFYMVANGTIENNEIIDGNQSGLVIRLSNDMKITDNMISGSKVSNGIYIFNSRDLLLDGNQIDDNKGMGIAISGSNGVIVNNNQVMDNRITGIGVSSSSGCLVKMNLISVWMILLMIWMQAL